MAGVDLAKLRAAQEAAAAAGSAKAQQALAAQANGGNAFGGTVTVQSPVQNPSGGSMTAYNAPAVMPTTALTGSPAVSMAPTTNYVQQGAAVTGNAGAGKTLNDILYAKDQYDAGNKQWATSTAQGLYSQLDPALAKQVQGMSAAQLRQYLAGQSAQPATSAPTAMQSAPSVGSAVYPSAGYPVSGSSAPAPAQADYQSTYTGPDMTAMTNQLNTLYDNRLASETQKLRDALATALQGYNAQETQAKQSAYDNRNAADVVSMQGQQAMAEQMANAGLTTDGQNLSLAASQAASRQGALTDINRSETNALQNISEQRSNLQNNAAQNELALTQSVGADKAAALFDLLKYGDSRAFDMDQVNYGRYRDDINQQFAEDQFDWTKLMQEAGLTGVYNGQSTMAGKQQNLDAALSYSQLTGQVLGPQSDWSGLLRQAASGSAPLSLAGQQAQLQRQQANLGAAIDVSGLTGSIVNPQSDWSGLFRQAAGGGNGPTMAALQQAFQQAMSQQQYNRGVYESDRNYQMQSSGQSFDQWLAGQNLEMNKDKTYIDYLQAANSGGSKSAQPISPVDAGSMLKQSLSKVISNKNGKTVYGTITDPTAREKAFLEAFNTSGISSGTDAVSMLSKAGYTSQEIAKYKSKYPEAFQ